MSKLTELLEIHCPNGVEYKKLGDLGIFENIGVDKKTVEGQPLVSLLNYVDVYKNIHIGNNVPKMIVSATTKKIKDCTCEKGDIFITPTSETRDDIGHAAVVTETLINTVYSYHIMRFRLTEINMTTSFFIRYMIESELVQKQIYKLAKGLTRFGLSKYDFAKIEIPFPPIEVQEEIVRILDQFRTLAAELQAELQARQEQYEYYRNKLLTFNKIGGGIQGVIWMKMSEVYDMKAGKTIISSMIENVKTLKNPYPCYGGNGLRGYVSEYNQQGDKVLIGRQGALCGNVCFANNSFYATEHAVVVSEKGYCLPRYTYHLLTKMKLNQYKTAGAQPGLSVSRLEKLLIPIPSIGMQLKIVSILDRFDELISDLSQGLPAEIEAVQEQYEYYRDKLLSFTEYKLSA